MATDQTGAVVVEPLVDALLCHLVPGVPVIDGAPVEGRPEAVARAVVDHREHRFAWYGDLVGALRVPASATASLLAALQPGDHGLPVVLTSDAVADDLLGSLRRARSLLLDNHRVELTGVELPFAAADSAADAARLALDALDFTVPAWFMVRAEPGWEAAFDVLAQDGAESVALQLPAPGEPQAVEGVAGVLRALIDRELPFAVTEGVTGLVTDPDGHGLLNLLVATRAAIDGVPTAELVPLLVGSGPVTAVATVRRLDQAQSALTRAFLTAVTVPSIHEMVEALAAEGLIEPDAA